MIYTLSIKASFDAAHFLKDYEGPCSEMHGHTWKVIAAFRINEIDSFNISVDFKKVKEMVNNCLPDHQLLNTFYNQNNPTAEWLVEKLFKEIQHRLAMEDLDKKIILVSIELFETENNSIKIEYTPLLF